MDQDRKLELIDLAVQKLIHDNNNNTNTKVQGSNHNLKDHEAEYQQALSHLLSVSQSEMLKRDDTHENSEASSPSEVEASVIEKTGSKEVDGGEVDGGSEGSDKNDEIIIELKKVKRQNFVTHCLLSVMIVLTVTWQLSEVSLILKVKDGLNHPFRSFGNMLKRMVKVPNGQEAADDKEHPLEPPSSFPSIKIPEMPHVDMPNLGLSDEKE